MVKRMKIFNNKTQVIKLGSIYHFGAESHYIIPAQMLPTNFILQKQYGTVTTSRSADLSPNRVPCLIMQTAGLLTSS